MSQDSQSSTSSGGFLWGAGFTGIIAWIHNEAKNKTHRRELQDMYAQGFQDGCGQMRQVIQCKDMELRQKGAELADKDAAIVRLNAIVENQAKALAKQQLQLTAPLWPDNNNDNRILN